LIDVTTVVVTPGSEFITVYIIAYGTVRLITCSQWHSKGGRKGRTPRAAIRTGGKNEVEMSKNLLSHALNVGFCYQRKGSVINSIAFLKILLPLARRCRRSELSGVSRLLGATKLQSAPGADNSVLPAPLKIRHDAALQMYYYFFNNPGSIDHGG